MNYLNYKPLWKKCGLVTLLKNKNKNNNSFKPVIKVIFKE